MPPPERVPHTRLICEAFDPSAVYIAKLVIMVLCLAPRAGLAAQDEQAAASGVDLYVGLSLGLSIPGDQDLKLKLHDANLVGTDYLFTGEVEESLGPFVNLFLTGWGRKNRLEHFGFQTEVAYWWTHVEGKNWVDQSPAPDPDPFTPFTKFDQHRVSIFLSLLGRIPLGSRYAPIADRPFLFAGIGGGGVYSNIEHGKSGWDGGIQILAGTSVPVSEKLRVRFDFRYLLAPDAEPAPANRWWVDTSGTRGFPFMAHYDTRFFVLQLGVEYGL